MATALEVEYIIIISLCAVLALLMLMFAAALLVLLKKRRLFCFKRNAAARPFAIPDHRIEAGLIAQGAKRRSFFRANPARHKKPKKSKLLYEPLIGQSPSTARRNPFANSTLENPMVDAEELHREDWTNPAFDKERASRYDAAVVIQSWYRMNRQDQLWLLHTCMYTTIYFHMQCNVHSSVTPYCFSVT